MNPRKLLVVLLVLAAAAVAPGSASAFPDPDCNPPTIDGIPRVGETLTGSQAACGGLPPPTISWAWSRCDSNDGSGCTLVGTGSSYQLTSDDLGSFMRLRRTASNGVAPDDVDQVFSARVKGHAPSAAFTASPTVVKRGQEVTFNGSGSHDPDGQSLSYHWDLDGNGSLETNTGTPTASQHYTTPGTRTVHLKVTDSDGDASSVVARTVRVKGPPSASFVFSPGQPKVGEDVTFTSTATDPDGDALSYAWDLDGDGAFDDGNAAAAHATYSTPGTYTASLQVTADGETTTFFRSVDVDPLRSGKKKRLKLLRPFPKVAIGGFITSRGVRLTLLAVRAPRGSKVMIRCKGHGCPRRTSRKRVGRKKSVGFPSFRRRFLAGTVIKVYVWKKNRIGKYTRFGIRGNRRPTRRDRCLNPTKLRPTRCP